jgi:nucleoside-diphosphate-sugar epimerase
VGRACVGELLHHGYEVFNVDLARPAKELCPFTRVDFTDFGQTIEALSEIDDLYHGVDAVVHLAAIPGPTQFPNSVTFEVNTVSTYNVFEAVRKLGIKNVVWASSRPGRKRLIPSPNYLVKRWRSNTAAGTRTSKSLGCVFPT